MTLCPKCQCNVRTDRAQRHLRKVHGIYSADGTEQLHERHQPESCPVRRTKVGIDRLERRTARPRFGKLSTSSSTAVENWTNALLLPALQDNANKRPFSARWLRDTRYVLVEYCGSLPGLKWSALIELDDYSLPDRRTTAKIAAIVDNRLSKKYSARFAPSTQRPDFEFYKGRLTDHGWHIDSPDESRESALRSAVFEHGIDTIYRTLEHLKKMPWTDIGNRSANINADIIYVRTDCFFESKLRNRHRIPSHCTSIIDATKL